MNSNLKTDFLTATSTFLIGVGSVMNLAGNYYSFNVCEDADADARALAADWIMVGRDMKAALKEAAAVAEQAPKA